MLGPRLPITTREPVFCSNISVSATSPRYSRSSRVDAGQQLCVLRDVPPKAAARARVGVGGRRSRERVHAGLEELRTQRPGGKGWKIKDKTESFLSPMLRTGDGQERM